MAPHNPIIWWRTGAGGIRGVYVSIIIFYNSNNNIIIQREIVVADTGVVILLESE